LVDAAGDGKRSYCFADVNSALEPRLTHLEDHQLSLMHANYFANQYDYIGYASPIDDRSAWGIS
jgi:hypothetical protein